MFCDSDSVFFRMENRHHFISCVRQLRQSELNSRQRMSAIQAGLASIIPLQLVKLFNPKDAAIRTCGVSSVNIDFLKVDFLFEKFFLFIISLQKDTSLLKFSGCPNNFLKILIK